LLAREIVMTDNKVWTSY